MATKTAKKASKDKKKGAPGPRPRITAQELEKAEAKLQRKKGYSLVEFAEAMNIKILRARSILKRVKAKASPLGTGKENRTKLYTLASE